LQAVDQKLRGVRTISLIGNAKVARAAFQAAVRCYPDQKWLLSWRAYVVEKYEPTQDT
jgi:hypothetical protein